jgi:hypothetical protein
MALRMAVGRRSLLPVAPAPMCQCRRLGRERPSLYATRLRPEAPTRGSLTPQVSAWDEVHVFVGASRASRSHSRLSGNRTLVAQ